MAMPFFAVERHHPVGMLAGLNRIAEPKMGVQCGVVPEWRRNLTGGAASAAKSDIVVTRIPFTGEVTAASPGSLEFHFRDTDATKVLQPKRLVDAFHFKGSAFLSSPDLSPREVAALR